ncbi:AAA family ATPase [Bacillus subtilis]|uniref:AAA family ATPase n=1 Tax=Bacillus subtilis TaxID=1423 RepID=UPI000665D67B|nr:AAA family ATPase [Bacillus subtilis]
MGKNIIYYGPPGTGKTFLLQNLRNNYTDFNISDNEIQNAYVNSSQDWVLIALILLQNNNLLSNTQIQNKIQQLNVSGFNQPPSSVLNAHSVSLVPPFTSTPPQIFGDEGGNWFVVLNKLLDFDPTFFDSYLTNGSIGKRFCFVTFHQSFTYEDFIEGIRPKIDIFNTTNGQQSGDIQYEIKDGLFKELCEEAKLHPTKEYAIFIDEINRGNISEIFGDLISLVELDKRLGMPNELKVRLPYSKTEFGVPQNISIYGTMNSADRSIALIDIALRRRFEFEPMTSDLNILESVLREKGVNPKNINGIDLVKLLETINKRIQLLLDENFVIGHAYFTPVTNFESLKEIMIKKVIPLLEEYFFDDLEKVQLVLADLDEDGELKDDALYKHEILDVGDLLEYQGDFNLENKKKYFVTDSVTVDSLKKIYL